MRKYFQNTFEELQSKLINLEAEHVKDIKKLKDSFVKKMESMIPSVRVEGIKKKIPHSQHHLPQRVNTVKTRSVRSKSNVKPFDTDLNTPIKTIKDNQVMSKYEDILIKQIINKEQDINLEYKVNDIPKHIEIKEITENKIKVKDPMKAEDSVNKKESNKDIKEEVKLENNLIKYSEPRKDIKINELKPIENNETEQPLAIFNTPKKTTNIERKEEYVMNSIIQENSAPSSPFTPNYDDTQMKQSVKNIKQDLKEGIELLEHRLKE